MPSTTETLEQIKNLYQNLTIPQKVTSALIITVVLCGFAAVFFFTNRPTYRILYSDLSPEDAADVVNWLEKDNVACRLAQGGTAVEVPEDRIYEVRLALASAGLPKEGGVGFEIFDRSNLGATDFVQQVNYQRALQGELERTIAQFPQVQTARVHLAQPKESLFLTERHDPTASIVLTLERGEQLDRSQVKGIVHLVASAVPRLDEANVSVVDTSGNVLYEHKEVGDDSNGLTNTQLAYQRHLEDYYKQKIQGMLVGALGPNKAVARVSAELDFDQVQMSEERFDPDTVAVRSEQKLLETTQDSETGGIPGVKGGLADKLQGNLNQAGSNIVRQRQQGTTNYEITRFQRQINEAVGELKRLSVGVIVDGTYKEGEKKGEKVYVPRTEEEIANLERIVKATMGFSEERGDELSVVNVMFSEPQSTEVGVDHLMDVGTRLARPLINLIFTLLFIFLVLRPLLNRYVLRVRDRREASQTGMQGGALALEAEERARLPSAPPLEPLPNVQEELRDMAGQYPERAAALIKVWLCENTSDESANA